MLAALRALARLEEPRLVAVVVLVVVAGNADDDDDDDVAAAVETDAEAGAEAGAVTGFGAGAEPACRVEALSTVVGAKCWLMRSNMALPLARLLAEPELVAEVCGAKT